VGAWSTEVQTKNLKMKFVIKMRKSLIYLKMRVSMGAIKMVFSKFLTLLKMKPKRETSCRKFVTFGLSSSAIAR
jgi:hypothetical protein